MAETDDMQVMIELAAFDKLIDRAYPTISDEGKAWFRRAIKDNHRMCSHLFEMAVTEVGGIAHDPTFGKDHIDGSDCKFSTVRLKSHGKTYAARVGDFHNKKGFLRVYVFERIQNAEYFFRIPYNAYSGYTHIEIPFYKDTGFPKRRNKWWKDFEVQTFDELCAVDTSFVVTTPRPVPYMNANFVADKQRMLVGAEIQFAQLFTQV